MPSTRRSPRRDRPRPRAASGGSNMSPSQWTIAGSQAAEHGAVDVAVVVGRAGRRGQRAAGHHHHLGSLGLDQLALLLVGGADLARAARPPAWSVPAPHASAPPPSAAERRISSRAAGQPRPMPRWAVSIASATPSPCAHRWRRKASVASQSTPPPDRVGDDVRGGEGDPRGRGPAVGRERARLAGRVRLEPSARPRQRQSSGTSTHRRSLHDRMPSSASCTPRAAAWKSHGNGAPCATWRRKCSHWNLNALPARAPAPAATPRGGRRVRQVGVPDRARRGRAGWMRQSRRPATACPRCRRPAARTARRGRRARTTTS